MKDEESELLAHDLDAAYRHYLGTRAQAKLAIRAMLAAAIRLASVVGQIRGSLRGSFVRWCRIHCRAYEQREGKAVCAVADKQPDLARIETWQLRLLNVVTAIHHAHRPMAAKRKQKAVSWVGAVANTRDKVQKIIEQAGGVEGMDGETRDAITRQLDSLAQLRDKVRGRRA